MAVPVVLPKLDEAMQTGKIVEWMRKGGDRVNRGDIIFRLETEKVTFDVEAEADGILSKVMVGSGDEVAIGTTIAFILQPGEKAPELPSETLAKIKEEAKVEAIAARPISLSAEKAGGVKASPLAKKIAEENHIDLSLVLGTGPGGRIVQEDVLKFIEEKKKPFSPTSSQSIRDEEMAVPLSSMRQVIARRMTESVKAPHFYMTVEVDTTELSKLRQQLLPIVESKAKIRLTVSDLLIKMTARALEENPAINCAYIDGSIKMFKRIDIGLVTAVEGGLYVPVIRRANKKSFLEIAQSRSELVQKARENRLTRDEMSGSTFTLSNMGMFEVDQFTAILQPPEAAILAVARIIEKPVAVNGAVVIRPMMSLTLSLDHRVLDAVMGANFLKSLKSYIENPLNLLV